MNGLALSPIYGIELFSGVGMLGEGFRDMKSIPGFEGRYSATEDGRNNASSNLDWATQSENILDKSRHGTMVKGEAHHACAISDADVAKLKKMRIDGLSYPYLGRLFGISKSQAHRIVTGQNRKDAQCG